MKIYVTGASGQLGYDVCRELTARGLEYRGVSSKELDITDREAVRRELTTYRPDAIIHCAAYTKVDKAEVEPEKCWAVNADGTRNLAEACREIGAKLLYVSTDYVFEGTGNKPYETDDPVRPQNVYGASKLAGELVVKSFLEKYFIVRTSWVFGKNGSNFVKTMLRLAETNREINVVSDQIGSPTYSADLAPLLCEMVRSEEYGTYHATNEGFCSWAEFAKEIFRQAGKRATVHQVSTKDYLTAAGRPLNSRLSRKCLDGRQFSRLSDWHDALARYLTDGSDYGQGK